MNSWRDGTKKCYNTHLQKWFSFCVKNGLHPYKPPCTKAIKFLTSLYTQGYSYTQINTARSTLSAVIEVPHETIPWGKLPIVTRFMKGIFQLKPTFPKYNIIWDVSILFKFFRSLGKPHTLDLPILSKKLAILLGLLSGGQRCQTIHAINVLDIKIVEDIIFIPIMSTIKQSRPGHHIEPLKFKCYTQEPKLCVVTHLTVYLQKTKPLRKTKKLFLSLQKPHSAVSKDTISRWCKDILKLSGIDTSIYSSHSSRSAATSMARKKGMSLASIVKYAGWSNESTFARFYSKDIVPNEVFQQKLMP